MSQEGRKLISQKLKNLRQKHNLTREKLSLALGYDNSYISKVEKLKVNVSIDFIEKVSNYFNLSIETFFKQEKE